jgi:hypothetical protein
MTLQAEISTLNIATCPIRTAELYQYVFDQEFCNETSTNPPYYNFKSKHCRLLNGKDGYLFDKDFILKDIKIFMDTVSKKIPREG